MSRREPPTARTGQLALALSLDPGATFASFHAEGNELSVDLLQRLARGTGERQVLLCGVGGAGKTHLLQAVCDTGARCAERLNYLPLSALADEEPARVLAGLEALAIVCLDELEAVLPAPVWQRALFDLMNRLRDSDARVVLASRVNPRQLSGLLPDLASRLAWGPVMQLQPLRDERLARALRHRARMLGLHPGEQALTYLAQRGPRAVGRLFRLLAQLDRDSLAEQRRLTVPFIRSVLARDTDRSD